MSCNCTVHIRTRIPGLYPQRLADRLGKVRYAQLSAYDAVKGHLEVRCEVLPALITVRSILDGDMSMPGACVHTYWFGTALSRRLRRLGP